MGVLNPHHPSTTYLQELRDPTGLAGNVGIISQSGAVCVSLLTDTRRFGFSHVVSSGNEAVLAAADYIEYLADDHRPRSSAPLSKPSGSQSVSPPRLTGPRRPANRSWR
jgi:acyl-CoA synthetase (NDP forming)